MDERRNYQRVHFTCNAEINCNDKKYHGELFDISLQGAKVLGKDTIPFAEGNRCKLSLRLPDSEITMQFEADIIHLQEKIFGFKFVGEDLETATHLRRLLELNIGSSEALEREVSIWLKDR